MDLGTDDPPACLGALKVFAIPSDNKEEEERAIARLESEVRALQTVRHPAVLKLLHVNVPERFIVTEYHQNGTLAANLSRYKGNALAALEAFKLLVEGVLEIHKQGVIHRDIKPENIFIGASGDLVLGDFGVVFFQDAAGERLTTTFERVGSRYWMAPWADDNHRLALSEIDYSLDVFPLGKVLWSMISGRNGFPYWEYDQGPNNLEEMFPGDPIMTQVNRILAKCVVRHQKGCLPTLEPLMAEVNGLIDQVKARPGGRPEGATVWPCHVCGRGNYGQNRGVQVLIRAVDTVSNQGMYFSVFVCDHCGHTELFRTS